MAGVLLVFWALGLHVLFFASAGALWRDEANSVYQARLPSWHAICTSLQFDSFPLLYPVLLRFWSCVDWVASDAGLRAFGFLVGLAVLLSLFAAGRLLGSRWPVVALALAAVNPLVVAEGDSLRPYGIGFLCLIWAFVSLALYAARQSDSWLFAAVLFSILSVQASYSSAVQVAAMSCCAAAALWWTGRRSCWIALLPGGAAAASMVPYAGVLLRIGDWAPLVRQRVDWIRFYQRHLDWETILLMAVWSAATAWSVRHFRRTDLPVHGAERACVLYSTLSAAALFAAQIAAIEFQGVPPFPRYFLPSLVPAALAVDVLTRELRFRMLLVASTFLLLAVPSWGTLTQRRTNMDFAAAILAREAEPRDLILVSPWFLHPGFQRYYHGSAEWTTVPVLPRSTMMRYDLIRAAMADPGSETALSRCLDKAFSRGGRVWLLTQRRFRSDPGSRIPVRPQLSGTPGGEDYVRFRSYWEEGIEYRLRTCCSAVERMPAGDTRVWDEEDTMLIRWTSRPR